MTNIDHTATYNLKAVVQQTGLKPDTLRAWERRYGLPDPERTTGGHRIYSEHDIQVLKWLVARQEEGLSISRAVELWQNLRSEGKDPLRAVPTTSTPAPEPLVPEYAALAPGDAVADLRNKWIDACMNFDERRSESILMQAFSFYSPDVVCVELLQKGLAQIGNDWYQGKITVQQEHFASALAVRRLDALLAATPAPTRPERLIVACAPEDDHTFSPLLLSLLLRRQGLDVIYLGADVPANRLQGTVVKTEPDLVIFSAQLLSTAANLLEVAHLLQNRRTMLAYGGLVFNILPALRERVPGHFLGERLERAPLVVEQLLAEPRPAPEVEPLPEEYQHAHSYFRERALMVESEVWRQLADTSLTYSELGHANTYMTRNILAALSLGNLNFAGTDMHWVEGLMVNYNIPPGQLHRFVATYYEAARMHLTAESGGIILEWLGRILTTAPDA